MEKNISKDNDNRGSTKSDDPKKKDKWIERNKQKGCCFWEKDKCTYECQGKLIMNDPKENEPKQKWSINENNEIVSGHEGFRLCNLRNINGAKRNAVGVLPQDKCNPCTKWNFPENSGTVLNFS